MKPAGVHHVAICVADAQKGLAFYCDVLGMTQLPRPDLGPGCWLDAGGQQVHLMESDTQPPGANHFAIQVDDIDAAVTDLQEQGVEVHRIARPAIVALAVRERDHGDTLAVVGGERLHVDEPAELVGALAHRDVERFVGRVDVAAEPGSKDGDDLARGERVAHARGCGMHSSS